ncbi:MAG TPA: HEPN domain-containing protein [Streptosporangiaceae bacterium]|nr:HEPN domain-containing protein [Streptosporangiaceae bacterium]
MPAVVADLAHVRPIALDTQVLLLTTVAAGLHRCLYRGDVRFEDDTAREVRDAAAAAVSSIHEKAEEAVRGLLGHVEDVGYGKRLARLAARVDSAVPGVTGKTNRWKSLVSDARNEYAHRLNTEFLEDEDFDRYLTVALSLRWLHTGVLLLQADISAEVLAAGFENHEPYQRFLADARQWQPRVYEPN